MKKFNLLVEALESAMENNKDTVAYRYRDSKNQVQEINYQDFSERVHQFAAGLVSLGIKPKEHVALIADVGPHWPLADFALQLAGIVDVPRGTDSNGDELAFIINHADVQVALVQDENEIDKINNGLNKYNRTIKQYIVLIGDAKNHQNVFTSDDIIEKGKHALKDQEICKQLKNRRQNIKANDMCTIVYTSGTTGEPKGVMLTQGNFAYNLNCVAGVLDVNPGERGLTLLPPWHVMGRICEYIFFTYGCTLTYTDIKNIGNDLKNTKPHFVPAVPRIWESVYSKVFEQVKKSGKENAFNFFKNISLEYKKYRDINTAQDRVMVPKDLLQSLHDKIIAPIMEVALFLPKKAADELVFKKVLAATGGCLRASISGGGALPEYIDDFFSAIGVVILNGYGLTETSPIISARMPDHNVSGTVGRPMPETEVKLMSEDGRDITSIQSAKGTLHVRGPQVMLGYYNNEEKTAEVLSKDGWFNTGDLMQITESGDLFFVGRSKDTVVLMGGENVEPTPIEDKMKESPYVDHIMIVGQDQKTLAALIVPDLEALKESNLLESELSQEELNQNKEIKKFYKDEIKRLVNSNDSFKSFERITNFKLLKKPFEKGDELNNTLKLRRHVVQEKYDTLIKSMYK